MNAPSDPRSDLLSPASAPRQFPSTRRRSDPRGPESYYVGRRSQETNVYVITRAAVEPLQHHGYRSTAPFDWGTPTPGALELAYAMLAHSTASRPPDPICTAFLADIVGRLDRPGFVLSYGEIALWLLTSFGADEEPSPRRGRRLRDRLRQIRQWRRGR